MYTLKNKGALKVLHSDGIEEPFFWFHKEQFSQSLFK